jgi:hypothetical protein
LNKKVYILILLLVCFEAKAAPSGSIVIFNGSQLIFPFNSLARIDAGITLTNYTHLKVIVDDDTDAIDHWELIVRSMDNQFLSDYNSNPSPPLLSNIRIIASGVDVTSSGFQYFDYYADNTGIIIASCASPIKKQVYDVYITYDCGVAYDCTVVGSMCGLITDYYSAFLQFYLVVY